MNRPRKGQRGHKGHTPKSVTVPELARLLTCPDCNSELTLRTTALGVLRAEVGHDETCPTYRRMEREAGR